MGSAIEGLLLEILLSHSVHKVQPRVVTGENFLKCGKKFYCVFGYTSLIMHLAI